MIREKYTVLLLLSLLVSCGGDEPLGYVTVEVVKSLNQEFQEYLAENNVPFKRTVRGFEVGYMARPNAELSKLISEFQDSKQAASTTRPMHVRDGVFFCCNLNGYQGEYIEMYYGAEFIDDFIEKIYAYLRPRMADLGCDNCEYEVQDRNGKFSIIFRGVPNDNLKLELKKVLGFEKGLEPFTMIGQIAASYNNDQLIYEFIDTRLEIQFD